MARILAWFDSLGRTLNAIERLALNTIAALAPWLSPLIPAWLAYHNLLTHLDFPSWLASIGGVVVECLGLSAIHTTYQLWDWNDAHADRAPTRLAAGVGGFYLVIVITVNVILDLGHSTGIQIIAKAFLSLISIASGIILALRAQHTRRVIAIEKSASDAAEQARAAHKQLTAERRAGLELQKAERLARIEANKQVRLARVSSQADVEKIRLESSQKLSAGLESSENGDVSSSKFPRDWRKLTDDQKLVLYSMSEAEITLAAGIGLKAARLWKQRLEANGFHPEVTHA